MKNQDIKKILEEILPKYETCYTDSLWDYYLENWIDNRDTTRYYYIKLYEVRKKILEKIKELDEKQYSSHCPYCDSQNITMIWNEEYNDYWACDDCKKTFWAFIGKEENL